MGKGISLWKTSAQGSGTARKAIFWAFFVALVMKIFIFDFMIAEGHSMVPAIKPGTILIVCRIYYGIRLPGTRNYLIQWRFLREGDVVVFFTPHGDIAVKRSGKILADGNFYALGDNVYQSFDSRSYGPVPKGNIIGRVIGIR